MKSKKEKFSYGDNDFKIKYDNQIAGFSIEPNKLRKFYDEGNAIEAFAILMVKLERAIDHLWRNYLINSKGLSTSSYTYVLKTELESNNLIKILVEVEEVSNSQYAAYREFKKGRNVTVHEMPNSIGKIPNRKILNNQFEQGMILYEQLSSRAFETLPEIDKKQLKKMRDTLVNSVKMKRKFASNKNNK